MYLESEMGFGRRLLQVFTLIPLLWIALIVPGLVWADASPPPQGAFTIVVLPDTQKYCSSSDPTVKAIFAEQTQWIVDHEESHNIRFVLHEGDVVDGDGMDINQWNMARSAMGSLDGRVPYVIALGNHDYEGNVVSRFSYFNEDRYFGPGSPYGTQETVCGFFEENKTDNSYHVFRVGDADWMVVALQFGPPDEVVHWANGVVAAHPNHSVILVTHAYMYSDDTRYDWEAKGGSQGGNPHRYPIAGKPGETVNDGQELWDKLVKIHPNFRLVFSGHVTNEGFGLLTSIGSYGQVVHQMLANYQTGVYGSSNGGNGYMRLIDVSPDGIVNVRTYLTHVDEFLTTPHQQFTLEIAGQGSGEMPQDLALHLGSAEGSIKALEAGGFDLREVMKAAVERHDMARYLVERGFFSTAEWILEVKVLPILEQLEDVPALLSEATATIGDAKMKGINNLTIQSLDDCLASAQDSLDDFDVDGARRYLGQIIEKSLWQDTPTMLFQAQQIIKELEDAGDRRAFMAKGDYDRAIRALSRCDYESAQTYLEKVHALPDPAIISIAALSLLAVLWYKAS